MKGRDCVTTAQVMARRVTARIDLNALERNVAVIRSRLAPETKLLSVVKANAYGHGAVGVSKKLESIGVDYLGVATADEGMELRIEGVRAPILVLSGLLPWDEAADFFSYDLVPVIHDFDMMSRLAAEARLRGETKEIHLKFDTGMGRLGFTIHQADAVAAKLKEAPFLTVQGIISHFASSEYRDSYGLEQIETFRTVIRRMKEEGITPQMIHMANSGAITVYPEAHFTMVRAGISLYGYHPDRLLEKDLPVTPVMSLVSHIAFLRDMPAGTFLSYGRTFRTDRDSVIAGIPVGYADGYPRILSNQNTILAGGRPCPVAGRICMDWLLVDVTDVPHVRPGDDVTLIGPGDGGIIGADDIAERAGTIPYEILCNISQRITRTFV